jgi:hypothetical protein
MVGLKGDTLKTADHRIAVKPIKRADDEDRQPICANNQRRRLFKENAQALT